MPVAASDFGLELGGRPARVAGEDAEPVRRGARSRQLAHHRGAHAHVHALDELGRILGRARRAKDDEELLAAHRPAEEEHVAAAAQRLGVGEHARKRNGGGLVHDEADRAAALVPRYHEDRIVEVGIGHVVARDEEDRGDRLLVGKRRPGEGESEERREAERPHRRSNFTDSTSELCVRATPAMAPIASSTLSISSVVSPSTKARQSKLPLIA